MDKPFETFDRITANPGILGGKPCIRGMRLSVQLVLKLLADYPSHSAIFEDYPELEPEDLRQALRFAASMFEDRFMSLDVSAAK
jgi:uncharacterized protein (DUF433 family)